MAQKQPIPSGFDYKFVDPIEEEYICIICQSVLRSPVQTKCGHKFCEDCLMFAHKKSGKQECPIDREQLTEQLFNDKATERKILSSKVHCPNQGCTWQGELRDIQSKPVKPGQAVSQNHLDTCPMRVIPCSYKPFGCDFEGPRKSHSEHVITHHLAFTMEKMFSLQEENKKLKLQVETMAKDFEAKTNSVKDQTYNLKKQFLAIQQELIVTSVSNTNAIDENNQSVTEELGQLEVELNDIKEKCKNTEQHVRDHGKNITSITDQLSSLEHQVHGISEQTDDAIRKIQDKTTQLVRRKCVLLENQLKENSKKINKDMATNRSMIYSLDEKCIGLFTNICEQRDQNALWKIEIETLTGTLQKVKYDLIILVMVVAVVTMMVVGVLFVKSHDSTKMF